MTSRTSNRPSILQRSLLLCSLVLLLQNRASEAWAPTNPHSQHRITSRIYSSPILRRHTNTHKRPPKSLRQAAADDDSGISRDDMEGDSSSSSSSSRIIPAAMTGKSQLAAAFTALDESDQYDAVLTGLCAKILDATAETTEGGAVNLDDPAALLTEMNDRKIPASPRSLMALIDVSRLWNSFMVWGYGS